MIGYSVITTGYLILLATIINGIKGNTFTVLEIVKTVTPFILIVGTIVFLTYNIGKYYNNISKGRISKNYNTFSIIFMLLTLLEAIILYRTKTSLQFKRTSTIPTILYWTLILVGVINFIVVGIISIDLAYFNTDG
jgi:tryptophan-rich sensory protein